ncbi:iron-sulfur cluster-binding protein [archaeon CG_4_10_14_0_2_um_filter_Archaea_38_6]|nr:MAG: iron-sulfur cluster-binding protein [archaeon CG06_land_8_20_14_3_00_37_11]PJA21950.1 MAG: iron-sulfur cluster-binding protein [archaeon CG_4_10_14_0_2_um_filter_Archaea_38_6]
MAKKSVVSVLKTSPETYMNDYKKLMHLAGYKKWIKKSYETILKLNLSWSLFYPACSTPPWQLDAVLKTLTDDGYENLIPVENKTVVTNPWKGAKQNKWLPVLGKYGLRFTPLTGVEWVNYKPKGEMLALDELFQGTHKIPKIFMNKNVIHLPTQKTHGHTTITGAMKNAFGGLITQRRHHSHKVIHEVLVDLLTIQKEIHRGIFAVTDGTICGDGAGPRTMTWHEKNYLLASNDQVAVDALSAKMMGFEPMSIPFIKIAHDKGLGCGDIKQLDIKGEDVSRVNYGFRTGKSLVVYWDQVLRKKLPLFEPLLFHTPLFNACILGSAVYHDYFWYPFIGKPRVDKFMKSDWGKVFKRY